MRWKRHSSEVISLSEKKQTKSIQLNDSKEKRQSTPRHNVSFAVCIGEMAEDFARAVDDGLKLAKRIYFGHDRAVAAPRLTAPMERSSTSQAHLPSAPMVYAVIPDPGIVDNPDLPSYQPHVHGRCNPPALIPLQMNAIELHVDCYLDTALVTVTGSWRVHCVMGSKKCDCRIAIPIGDKVRF